MAESTSVDARESIARYEFPEVVGGAIGDFGGGSMLTARQLEGLHQQAYREGYDSGRAEGYAAGEREAAQDIRSRAGVLDALVRQLSTPLAELDQELVDSVAELALLIARHLVRRELKAAPGEVVAVVRETMRHLPVASRGTRLHLNPDDVELVRSALGIGTAEFTWRVEPDPLISRGGCLVETESSRIDATVETRLAAIASKMFGGERGSDRDA